MAKIWPVYEGRRVSAFDPWAEIPLRDAISLFELRQADFVSGLDKTPRFGDTEQDLAYRGYKHIVVEVDVSEGRREKWRPGFYKSRVRPQEAFTRLLKNAVAPALGGENVLRVEYAPATDSRGEGAVLITIVIQPDAIHKLKPGATLDALVKLRERLQEMREERTPIVEYATEAELAENAGH